MSTIIIDGLNEEDFRRSIENRLREDNGAAAEERLRRLLQPFARPGGVLPERFMTVTADDLVLVGWENLGDAVAAYDRPGHPITALSIAFGWPGEDAPGPDADGMLPPHIETGYFNDDIFPFSKSSRADLLEGYSYHGCTWAADFEAKDGALRLEGIDDLNGALAALEARLLASEEPDEEEIRAGSLGACLLSVLLVQVVRNRIASEGLPRPLCVTAGSSEVYPYFDAPVAGMSIEACEAAEAREEEPQYDHGIPLPRYSSLLMANIPRGRKRAALVLDESEAEAASRIDHMRELALEPEPEMDMPMREPALAATDAPVLPDITPVPGGPLLAKKPHTIPADFRDMLSPLTPARQSPAKPPAPVEPEPEPERALTPAPVEALTAEPLAAPGFTLLEPTIQERLQALLDGGLARPQPAQAPERQPLEEADPEPPAPAVCVSFTTTAWPMPEAPRVAQSRPVEEPAEVEFAELPEPKPAGLFDRLRAWIRRGR